MSRGSRRSRFCRSPLVSMLIVGGILGLIADASAQQAAAATRSAGKYLIGAWYFAGWWRDPIPAQYVVVGQRDWRPLFPEREPVIGWYDDRQELVDQEIDLAAAGGLDFFAFTYFTDRDDARYPGARQNVNNGLRFFLASPKKSRMRFCIGYVNNARYGIRDAAEWNVHVDRWLTYFKDPQYLQINGKPVFVVVDVGQMDQQWGGHAQAKRALDTLRQKAAAAGLPGLLVGGGLPNPDPQGAQARSFAKDGYDFFTAYSGAFNSLPGGEHSYSEELARAPAIWAKFELSPIPYMPVVSYGYDHRPIREAREPVYFVNRSPELFRQLLEKAKGFLDRNPRMSIAGQRMVVIYAWNELGEGGALIPTKAEGDIYLRQVDAVFGKR
jgi:Glycosyltransferase WbsX